MLAPTSTNAFARTDTVLRKERLTDEHSDMVRRVARRLRARAGVHHRSTVLEEDDLFSVGMMGLYDAHKRFDPEEGTEFRSFAEFRVKGAMLDELRRRDIMPRRLRAKWRKLKRAEAGLESELGRTPEEAEVASALGLEIAELARLRREIESHVEVTASTGLPLTSHEPSPEATLQTKEKHMQLADAIRSLSKREQLVLDLYYKQDLTLREIAEMLELTEGRISQLKSGAVKKLRAWFDAQSH